MGTLFNQQPRKYYHATEDDVDRFLGRAKALANKHKISVGDVLEANKLLEYERRTDFMTDNGDVWDEQMAGFGEILQEVVAAIYTLSSKLGD